MKFFKTTFVIVACAALFSSCSNEAEEVIGNDVKVDMTFGISASNPSTRAYLPNFPTSKDIYWEETDKVSVFASGHENEMGDVFSFGSYQTEHNDATFTGKSYANANNYYILYPAQQAARLTDEGVEFNIPSEQTATKNTFDPKACIQIGKGKLQGDGLISLKNVCAFFYITVTSGCSYVEVKALTDDWHLAGTCIAGIEDTGSGGVIIKHFGNCTNTITLKNIPSDGGTFFIPFIPTSNSGSEIEVTAGYGQSEGGPVTLQIQSNVNFVAAHCYNIGTISPKSTNN